MILFGLETERRRNAKTWPQQLEVGSNHGYIVVLVVCTTTTYVRGGESMAKVGSYSSSTTVRRNILSKPDNAAGNWHKLPSGGADGVSGRVSRDSRRSNQWTTYYGSVPTHRCSSNTTHHRDVRKARGGWLSRTKALVLFGIVISNKF